MTSSASQPYSVDWRYIKKVWREITASEYLKEKIDAIPEVVDNVHDRSTDKALSANMWRLLQDQIDELKTPWKFLGNWNASTWLSEISLPDNPYVYWNWDYFVVSVVSQTTNYKPEWIMYTDWVASQTVETWTLWIDDRYMFNGNEWVLIPASQRQIAIDQALSPTSTNPVENRVIKAKIDSMDADIEDKANASSGSTWEQPAWNPGDIYVDEDEDKIYIKWVDEWKDISEQWAVYTAWEGIEITEENVINCTVEWETYEAWKCIEITEQNVINVDGDKEFWEKVTLDILTTETKMQGWYINPSNVWKTAGTYFSWMIPVSQYSQVTIKWNTSMNAFIYVFMKNNNTPTSNADATTWYATWSSRTQVNDAEPHTYQVPSDAQYLYLFWVWASAANDYTPDYVKTEVDTTVTLNLVERVEALEDVVYEEVEPEQEDINWFRWKIISIMWDSISTFAGWIPVADWHNLAHRARYPQANLFTDVKYCWWYKLINNLWAKLWINDSWAWSRVHNSAETNSWDQWPDACMAWLTRITNLWANWTPDLIIYYGWTNDCWAYITPWTFNSSVNYNTVDLTTYKWTTFADAFRDSIMRMQYFYPFAKIIVLLPTYTTSYYTLPELDTYNDLIKEICDYFWVPRFDLRECGINWQNKWTTLWDGIHPTASWADMIERFVRAKLLWTYSLKSGENVTYSITNSIATWVTTDAPHIKAVSEWKSYTATITSDSSISVSILMWWDDISSCYDSSTWVITIPAVTADVEITVTVDSTMTSYTVNHFQQNVDWSTYPSTATETETFSVAKWSSVTPAVNTYTWFTSPATQTVTVQDDWSTVVNYNYTRNQYQLSFDTDWWTPISTQSVYYNADIVIPETTKTWYHLSSDPSQAWTNYPAWWKMPASDLQLVANWIEDWWEPTIDWYTPDYALSSWTWTNSVNVQWYWWTNRLWTGANYRNQPVNMIKFRVSSTKTSWTIEVAWINAVWDSTVSTNIVTASWTSADKDASTNIVTAELSWTIQANYLVVFPSTQPATWALTYTAAGWWWAWFYTDVPVSRRSKTPYSLSWTWALHVQWWYKHY